MAAANDFLQDEEGEEIIKNGDYSIGESDQFHINDIVISVPGAWREFPRCGVAIGSFQSGNTQQQKLDRLIKQQLEADGYLNILTKYVEENNLFGVAVIADRP